MIINQKKQIIHFINRIDNTNVGDWNCCPLNYFYEFFKCYNLMRHDIDFIGWEQISKEDVVIIGAGGMLNVTQSFNVNINKLLDKCDTVIAWSVGFNTHNEQWFQGDDFERINYERFKLISIRDYNHPSNLEWLPCPIALTPEVKKKNAILRKIGVIEHKNLSLPELPYEKISNAYNIDEITDFISTSETIVTNSYHMVYLAHLMNKKAVVINKFSTKFDYYKYKPEFIEKANNELNADDIEEAAERALMYGSILKEAINLNQMFFLRVKEIIKKKILNEDNSYQHIYQLTRPNFYHEQNSGERVKIIDSSLDILHNRLTDFHSHIYSVVEEHWQSINQRIDEMDRLYQELLETRTNTSTEQSFFKSEVLDFSKIKTQTAFERQNQVHLKDLIPLDRIVDFEADEDFTSLIERICVARKNHKPVILFMGAHVIKCGLSLYIIDLIKRGWITHIAGNGAVSIHDFELAYLGATSEDVPRAIEDGSFGMWEETGAWMNEAISVGKEKGYGYAIASYMSQKIEKFTYIDYSVLYAAYKQGIPATFHVTLGADIIHQHPSADFGAIGFACGQDFYKFCESVSDLEGGVLLNFGSAVTGAEVFLKALSIVRNLGYSKKNITTANFDLKPLGDYRANIGYNDPNYYYRPRKNIINRPTQNGGNGWHFELDHKISIPALYFKLCNKVENCGT